MEWFLLRRQWRLWLGRRGLQFPDPPVFRQQCRPGLQSKPAGRGSSADISGSTRKFGQQVVGAEASRAGPISRRTRVGAVTPVFPADRYTTKIDSLDSATLRIGYAWANWLLYGRIGAAWARSDLDILSGLPVPGVAASSRQTLTGLTGGGGVEYMLTQNVILGAEYNYANLGRETITTTGVCTLAACTGSAPAVSLQRLERPCRRALSAGSAILFNWPASARPVKHEFPSVAQGVVVARRLNAEKSRSSSLRSWRGYPRMSLRSNQAGYAAQAGRVGWSGDLRRCRALNVN